MIDQVKQPNYKRSLVLRFQAWENTWSLSQALFALICVLIACGMAVFAARQLSKLQEEYNKLFNERRVYLGPLETKEGMIVENCIFITMTNQPSITDISKLLQLKSNRLFEP